MTNPAGQLRLIPRGGGTGPRYGSLLLVLVATYLLSAFTVGDLVSAVQVVLFLIVVLIALRTGRFQRRTGQLIALGLVVGTVVSAILKLVDDSGTAAAVASLWTALILLLAVYLIVRQVLSAPQITEQSIYGALSAYLTIGLIFAAVYTAMWKFSGGQFFANGETPNSKLFQYFSFTTLTTLGYGDFTAAGDAGRAVAVLEAVAGQMFLATLVARLVAGFRWSDRAAARHTSRQGALGDQAEVTGRDPDPSVPAGEPALHAGESALPPEERPPGPGRPKKAGAAGLVRLTPPGAVRGRGTGQRPGARKGTGGSGPAPPPAP
ncbi:MAG TPA: potassium channel family protein [Streptosporangiaceae bacterium]|nr:potassium channel family protein [Streptosporangiaceae bacterium]